MKGVVYLSIMNLVMNNEKLLARYSRPDNYKGHRGMNHYHWVVTIECYFCDMSQYRDMGVTIDGHEIEDYYLIRELNYKDVCVGDHKLYNKDDANKQVRLYLNGGFTRVNL